MHDEDRPHLHAKTQISASLSLKDSQRFHAIAAQQQKSLSRLIVDTLNRVYPKDEHDQNG